MGNPTSEIQVDGSMGEAGGQILRISLALAGITRSSLQISNIRKKRSTPGLRPQHLHAAHLIEEITEAETEGLEIGSERINFRPRTLKGGSYNVRIGTAGSIALLLQAALPLLVLAPKPSQVTVSGGTDVSWSPSIDYVKYVLAPMLKPLGVNFTVNVIQRGHYPRGGGKVEVSIHPASALMPINLASYSELVEVQGVSHCVRLPRHVAQRQAKAAKQHLQECGLTNIPINIRSETYPPNADPHLGPGSGITLWTIHRGGTRLGSDALGAPRKSAETVGKEAAHQLFTELKEKNVVDHHLADMLIPWMVLASSPSKYLTGALSSHTQTGIKLVELISNWKFDCTPTGKNVLVSCTKKGD